ncbi:MAG: bifunctional folylpolyglutamate synthase/dihydrofolate synthase [Candidatus Omnitrophica bacterium]|nr:bifunctional folylpolyglutamate synthase/dihydrofolate synthase [Candidatus Omnitrophota bacterium]
MKNPEDVIAYLNSFTDYERIGPENIKEEFNLAKLKDVLKRLGDPQNAYRSAHVAGTKGKGSISTFIASILKESGYKVGLFTSPHLVSPHERISINGKNINNEDLAEVLRVLKDHLAPAPEKNFTFFEIFTLAAILFFNMEKVDFAVFEVGLGGRLDATNVINAEVSAISPISYDHMQILGDTIEKIAAEKAAIIKPGSYCVVSPQQDSVLKIIEDRCSAVGVGLAVIGREIKCDVREITRSGNYFDIHGQEGLYDNCQTSLIGAFQMTNAAVGVGACEKLLKGNIDAAKIKTGIEKAFIPGRMEIIAEHPIFIIDGAQNASSARKLRLSIERIFRYDKLVLLLGTSRDKDIVNICKELGTATDVVITTKSKNSRAADPNILKGFFKGREVISTYDAKEALGLAWKSAKKNDLILATGSFYLIGEIREMVLGASKDRQQTIDHRLRTSSRYDGRETNF